MTDREKEMLFYLKKVNLEDYECGAQLAKAIGSMMNSLVHYVKEIGDALKKDSFLLEKFRLIFALACVQLAYEWSWEEQWEHPHMDERKKAAGSFSFKNVAFFEEEVKELIGIFPLYFFEEEAGYQKLRLSMDVYRRYPFVQGFLERWVDTHSTLKQGFVRLAYEQKDVLYSRKKKEWCFRPPLNYEMVYFPFI